MVKECTNGFADIKPGQMMLLPSASDIAAFITDMPRGQSTDLNSLRVEMAKAAGAEMSCPVVTGIHLRVVAEAAHEELERGAALSEITPVWRVIGPKTTTLKKLSFDPAYILDQRELEGIVD